MRRGCARPLAGSRVTWLVLASALALVACDGGAPAPSRPATVTAALHRVELNRTTPAELRSSLGEPDEQPPDGSLVYRFIEPRRGGGKTETETVHFRFDRGRLSKICRSRS